MNMFSLRLGRLCLRDGISAECEATMPKFTVGNS